MGVPTTVFMWIMACLPIIVLLILMIKLQWGATKAAPVGLAITIVTSLLFYKADWMLLIFESAKGVWSSVAILLIVWSAVLLYQVAVQAKAFIVIRNGMSRLLPNELLLVLAIGWVFVSFLQGITGFGVPVAVGAPLLIGIGVTPLYAVIIPLLGQAWGNTFGTLAAAWDSLAISADLVVGSAEYMETAFWSALFLLIWDIITGIAICWFYGKGAAVKKGLVAVMIIALVQGGGELLLINLNTTISCFVPSCIAMLAVLLIGKLPMYKEPWKLRGSEIMQECNHDKTEENVPTDMSLLQAFVPYILLTVLTLVVLLVTPIKEFLEKCSIGFSFPETATGYGVVNEAVESFSPITIFTHASMFLFLASIFGLLYYKKHGWIKEGDTKIAFKKSVSMTIPSAISVVCLIVMSKVMSGTGQTLVLADGISSVLGKGYAILSPIIGALGSFMTGSNMSSNILFGDFQITTANFLEMNAAIVLAAQTVGGSIGSAISPSKIILGTTTANILGEEGKVLRKLLPLAIVAALLMGVTVFVVA